jgi:hypothetical protein
MSCSILRSPSDCLSGGRFLIAVPANVRSSCSSIVVPAKAGIQLHTLRRSKLDPDFRQGDEEEMRGSSPRMTCYKTVMAVLDTAISRQRQMRGSSPRMT